MTDAISAEEAARLRTIADKIRSLQTRILADVVEIGRQLQAVKAELPHGQFGPWLKAEFNWSERTAQRYMSVTALGPDATRVSGLPLRLVYGLASAPEAVRQEMFAKAERPSKEQAQAALASRSTRVAVTVTKPEPSEQTVHYVLGGGQSAPALDAPPPRTDDDPPPEQLTERELAANRRGRAEAFAASAKEAELELRNGLGKTREQSLRSLIDRLHELERAAA